MKVLTSSAAELADSLKKLYVQPGREGWIYLIHAVGTNRYKIGRSTQMKERMEQLKKQSPYPLKLVASFWAPDVILAEKQAHEKFANLRVHGEWFEFDSDCCTTTPGTVKWAILWFTMTPHALTFAQNATRYLYQLIERDPIIDASCHGVNYVVMDLCDIYENISSCALFERVADFIRELSNILRLQFGRDVSSVSFSRLKIAICAAIKGFLVALRQEGVKGGWHGF